MPQIAQQDYLFIDVESIENLDSDNIGKQKVANAYKNGVLYDVILRETNTDVIERTARIVGYSLRNEGENVNVLYFVLFDQGSFDMMYCSIEL